MLGGARLPRLSVRQELGHMKRQLPLAAIAASCVAVAAPAIAAPADGGWTVSLTGYLWTPRYHNEVEDSVTGQTSESTSNFTNLISALRSIPVIVKGEAQYGRFGVVGDLIHLPLSQGSTIHRPILGAIQVDTDVTTTTATVAGFYRLRQTEPLNVDLLAGFRYVALDLGVDADGPGAGFSRGPSASFTEPILGLRATQKLGAKTALTGYGDYGGFGGRETVWQLIATVNYQWTAKAAAFAGWRHFAIDVDKGRLSTDVSLSGPLAGLTYRF